MQFSIEERKNKSSIKPRNEAINPSDGSNKQIIFKCRNDEIKEHKATFIYLNARWQETVESQC